MQFVRSDTREPLSRRGVVVSISTIRGEIARFSKGHEFTRRAAAPASGFSVLLITACNSE